MVRIYDDGYEPDDLQVKYSELLVATNDGSDALIDGAVPEVLKLLRKNLGMDVVFVSEFTNGRREFRHVDNAPGKDVVHAGDSDPLEESWCQHVVDGRLPEFIPDARLDPVAAPMIPPGLPIGTHMSTPIVLHDGSVYGTLCCFSMSANPDVHQNDMRKLKYTAQLTAKQIDQHAAKPADDPTKDWSLVPRAQEQQFQRAR